MTTIDLYQVLRKIPDVSEDQAKQAAASVADYDQVATKSDISALRADMAELESRLTWRMLSCTGLTIAAIGVLLALFK